MAYFGFLRSEYDTEVIYVYVYGIGYGTDTTLFLLLLGANVVCDLYFDGHILLCLFITLMLIIYIICIRCVYVREYYEYSLTANKSLL